MDNYFKTKYTREKEEEERSQLLERRTRGGPSTNMEQLYREGKSLQRSHRTLDDIENAGREIIGALAGQNEIIRNAQRKLWDVANTLGLSQSLIRRIQRRHSGDRVLVYTGMVLTLFILFLLWYFVM
eukprot:Phypoly_transcript_08268.p1 GENE.Phypoly_transcript_08268~~Phypoly_transcript_08268.p1  ORF type:complete len:127 (-),score=14.90 Phypoly_transcript_08268:358-738(-)